MVQRCRLFECGSGIQWCNGADDVSIESQYGISCPSGQRCNGADFLNVVEVVNGAMVQTL